MCDKRQQKTKPKPKTSSFNFKLRVLFLFLLTLSAINVLKTENGGSVTLRRASEKFEKKHHVGEDSPSDEDEDDPWDILMLVQQWPQTFCKIQYNKPSKINCRYPEDQDLWTIHGMWPTKRGSRGPVDCAVSHYFDMGQLTSIRHDLNYYWPNLKASASNQNFWSYEWRKHGTCALDHEDLNSDLKYFTKAIDIVQFYNMKNVLSDYEIFPSEKAGVPLSNILNAIKSKHRGRPDVQCSYDSSGRHLLKEIRLCFDRSNDEVDCDNPGNCPHGKDIFYLPATISE